jgi:DNA-binding transcriptional LysR family regulator
MRIDVSRLRSNHIIFHTPYTTPRWPPPANADWRLQRCGFRITLAAVIEKLRLFLVILEEGSLRRAAERLHISQSAITRQIQLLEHDLGGRILERTSAGVRPTNGGHTLAGKARSLLADYDSVMAEVRRTVRGESDRLRIGYVASAVQEYLGPALAALRRTYPKLKVKMLDQTPGEMIIALRHGEIDLALTGHGVDLLSRDFYTHKLASVPSLVALPLDHPLAHQKEISISQLKNESFIRGSDSVVPGYNQKIVQFCRRFGKYRPRFVSIGQPSGGQPANLAEGLVMAANEGAISLQPNYISHIGVPNVVMIPITDEEATWDLFLVWQRGKMSGPLRALLGNLQFNPKS